MTESSAYPITLLRVKRLREQSPLNSISQPAKRLCLWNPELHKGTHFCYVGSANSTESSLKLPSLRTLNVNEDAASHRVYWDSRDPTCLIKNMRGKTLPLQVSLSAKKHSFDDVADDEMPPKCLRVIDVTSSASPSSDALSITLNGLKLLPASLQSPDTPLEPAFVYDLYQPIVLPKRPPDESSPETFLLEDENDACSHSQDSDSNNESNWRNDYPDEEYDSSVTGEGSRNSSASYFDEDDEGDYDEEDEYTRSHHMRLW